MSTTNMTNKTQEAPAATPDAVTLLDGFRTPAVDVNDLAYQADPAFLPDKTDLWTAPAAHDGWVHAHNSIRYELGELSRVLKALGTARLQEWQVAAVRAWWAGHTKHVHEHHTNEDDIMNPFLRTRIAYPDKLEADHVDLVAAMDAIAAEVDGLAPGDTLEALRALWLHYESLMLPHLYEEEQVGLPLCRAYFTPAEVEKVTAVFLKKGDPVSLGAFVHVMGHKHHAQTFMRENGIPPFVWHLPGKGFKALRMLYRTKMQVHIDSLMAGEPVKARTKHDAKENAAKAAKVHGDAIAEQCILSPSKRTNVMRGSKQWPM